MIQCDFQWRVTLSRVEEALRVYVTRAATTLESLDGFAKHRLLFKGGGQLLLETVWLSLAQADAACTDPAFRALKSTFEEFGPFTRQTPNISTPRPGAHAHAHTYSRSNSPMPRGGLHTGRSSEFSHASTVGHPISRETYVLKFGELPPAQAGDGGSLLDGHATFRSSGAGDDEACSAGIRPRSMVEEARHTRTSEAHDAVQQEQEEELEYREADTNAAAEQDDVQLGDTRDKFYEHQQERDEPPCSSNPWGDDDAENQDTSNLLTRAAGTETEVLVPGGMVPVKASKTCTPIMRVDVSRGSTRSLTAWADRQQLKAQESAVFNAEFSCEEPVEHAQEEIQDCEVQAECNKGPRMIPHETRETELGWERGVPHGEESPGFEYDQAREEALLSSDPAGGDLEPVTDKGNEQDDEEIREGDDVHRELEDTRQSKRKMLERGVDAVWDSDAELEATSHDEGDRADLAAGSADEPEKEVESGSPEQAETPEIEHNGAECVSTDQAIADSRNPPQPEPAAADTSSDPKEKPQTATLQTTTLPANEEIDKVGVDSPYVDAIKARREKYRNLFRKPRFEPVDLGDILKTEEHDVPGQAAHEARQDADVPRADDFAHSRADASGDEASVRDDEASRIVASALARVQQEKSDKAVEASVEVESAEVVESGARKAGVAEMTRVNVETGNEEAESEDSVKGVVARGDGDAGEAAATQPEGELTTQQNARSEAEAEEDDDGELLNLNELSFAGTQFGDGTASVHEQAKTETVSEIEKVPETERESGLCTEAEAKEAQGGDVAKESEKQGHTDGEESDLDLDGAESTLSEQFDPAPLSFPQAHDFVSTDAGSHAEHDADDCPYTPRAHSNESEFRAGGVHADAHEDRFVPGASYVLQRREAEMQGKQGSADEMSSSQRFDIGFEPQCSSISDAPLHTRFEALLSGKAESKSMQDFCSRFALLQEHEKDARAHAEHTRVLERMNEIELFESDDLWDAVEASMRTEDESGEGRDECA